MIKTKQLMVAIMMLLSGLKINAQIINNDSKDLTICRIRSLVQEQSPFFTQKKTRGGSRLIANANYDLSSGSAVISDSSKYNYLPTNGYGDDMTANLFENSYFNSLYNFMQIYQCDTLSTYSYDTLGNVSYSLDLINTFNANHQLTNYTHVGSAAFPLFEQSNILYNTNGLKTKKSDTMNLGGFFAGTRKTIYRYNSTNKLVAIEFYKKDSTMATLTNFEIDSIFYDVNNNFSRIEVHNLQGQGTTSLTKNQVISYTYNTANKITSEIDETFNGITWDKGKIEYIYNSSNQILTKTALIWDGINYNIDNLTTFTYFNSISIYPSSITTSVWFGGIQYNNYRDVYTYNSSNQVLTDFSSSWDGSAWTPSANGIYYYETFTPQAVSNSTLDATVSMYPNPVENILNLNIQLNQDDNISIAVVDLNGKMVYQSSSIKGKNITTSINTNSFAKGIYLVQIKGNNGETVSKFVK